MNPYSHFERVTKNFKYFNKFGKYKRIRYYSQFGEDKIIESYFDEDYVGGCIDVGAYDGTFISNTKHFEELDWYCLCVEPNPKYYNVLKTTRLNSINYAISDVEGILPFNIVDVGDRMEGAVSALKIDERLFKLFGLAKTTVIDVNVITLDTCIQQFYKYNKIDFVSVDTEGTELDVLKGLSIEKWRPKLFVIENNFDDPYVEDYLKQYGYKKVKRLEVNDFYVL